MGWMQKLCETYDNCYGKMQSGCPGAVPLIPVAHTTYVANVDVFLNEKGDFLRAVVIDRKDARTVIPCTEESSGRTSGPVPLPLCDYVRYLASDLPEHLEKIDGERLVFSDQLKKWCNDKYADRSEAEVALKEKGEYVKGYPSGNTTDSQYEAYHAQLKQWCDSPYGNARIRAVLAYVEKGTVIADLIRSHILVADESGMLITDFGENEKPDLYKNFTGFSPDKTFIRWHVEILNNPDSTVCGNIEVQNSWTSYYESVLEYNRGRPPQLDMVTGKMEVPAAMYLAKLRNDGDTAKLISGNDSSGFTYRGRFSQATEACTIGYESSQKAMLVLRWLISRQGKNVGDWCFVCWSTRGDEPFNVADDPETQLFGDIQVEDGKEYSFTAEETAKKINQRMTGNGPAAVDVSNVVMMAMNSASRGRLSVLFYREITSKEYSCKINEWYETCSWPCRYVIWANDGTKHHTVVRGIFPPSFRRIIESAYGTNVDDKQKENAYARLTQCVVDGTAVPIDIVQNAVHRASRPESFDNDAKWQECLTTACALYRKSKIKESYRMVLERDRVTRSYLYGRLLAVADVLEYSAMPKEEKRPTNAKRLMTKFSERPYTTWKIIDESLMPYRARLGGRALRFEKELQEIMNQFKSEDFADNHPLEGEYLLAYYTEQSELWNRASTEENEKEEESQ